MMNNTPLGSMTTTTRNVTTNLTNDILTIPLPAGDPPPQIEQQIPMVQPFTAAARQLSFETLASQADKVMSSTLEQYGPAIGGGPHTDTMPTHNIIRPTQNIVRTTPSSQVPVYQLPIQRTPATHSTSSSSASVILPPLGGITNHHNASSNLLVNIPTYDPLRATPLGMGRPTPTSSSSMGGDSASGNVLVSEAPPMSPPLDALNNSNNNTVEENANESAPPQIDQRPNNDPRWELREKIKTMTMNELMTEYRRCERHLEDARKRRVVHEKDMKSLQREARGQSLDSNQTFLRKKRDYNSENETCQELSDGLKAIANLLEKKFSYRVTQSDTTTQPLQKKNQRAKMSTAAPTCSKIDMVGSEDKKIMLDLHDGDMWCQDCDAIFSTLKEYCDHLHKRDHMNKANKLAHPPWRTSMDPVSRRKSYDRYKSICARLSNKLRTPFSVKDLDLVLNPSQQDEEALKELTLSRERGNVSGDDPLFSLKGYDLLIPITGYYCKLCSCPLCDFKEAEQHLKSFHHNAEHAKTVALDPTHEKTFRRNLEKSKKRLTGVDEGQEQHRAPIPSTSKEDSFMPRAKKVSNSLDQNVFSARLPYKKPTSHIVDGHETIAGKFEQRKEKQADRPGSRQTDSRPNSRSEPVKSPGKLKRREIPDIVPITANQPSGALKRLRRERFNINAEPEPESEPMSDEPSAGGMDELIRRLESSPDSSATEQGDGGDEVQYLGEYHVPVGDPDSPFPDIELVVSGNLPHKALTDPRLAQPTVITMNRINLDNYTDMLLDSSSFWARIDKMMTKKEPDEYDKELNTVTKTTLSYFDINGQDVPIDADRDSDGAESSSSFAMEQLGNFFCDD